MTMLGGTEEVATVKLLSARDKAYGTFYDTQDATASSSREKRLVEESQEKVEEIPISQLFRYATRRDKWIIGIGTFFSIVHGAGFPLLALVFGMMTDAFLDQDLHGFVNETSQLVTNTSTKFTTLSTFTSSLDITTTEGDRSPVSGLVKKAFGDFMTEFMIYYLSIGVIVLASSFIQAICWEWACERQAYRLRQEFFYEILRKDISWFDHHQTGDLSIKLSDDLERIREGIGHKFSMVIQYVSAFAMGLVVGLATSWQLTLVIVSLTPLLAATSAFGGKMITTQSVREQQKYGKAGGVAEEVLSSLRTVAAFGGEKREIHRYSLALAAGLKTAIKKSHIFAVAVGLVFFVMYGSYALAFWYGCQLLDQGHITPGEIFTVFFSVLLGAFSLGNAIPFLSTISLAQGCGAIVFDIIDSKPKIDAYSNAGIIPDKVTGHIQFRDVSFRYPARKAVPILREFNLDIPAGKKVAIVGLSGSGKSTIVNLILRFYDPDVGSVLIDGNDLRALNLAWFRHHVGYVAQEPVLFGMSISENIRYGREDIGMDQVIQAAKMAYAHDFIVSLPQGYETLVGERGSNLSGGQRQRIAIARALARDPKILLLDEATSALDSRSEAVVQAALDHASRGRTTIIVAHRLSTVIDADIIYAIKDGRIMEQGTHYELMAVEGLYHDLVMAQTTVAELDGSQESADESGEGEESAKEFSFLLAYNQAGGYRPAKRKQRKHFRKRRAALPDPDRNRLIKEAEELNIKLPSFMKILRFNTPEMFHLLMGGLGCAITGIVMPVFAYIYSEMFATFGKHGEELLNAAVFYALMFLALAIISFLGYWSRTIFVSKAGEFLTMRLRLHSFANVIRQPIGWFENDKNSPSRICTRLARDAPLVKAAAGHRLAVVFSSFITVMAAIIFAFAFGWKLALVILSGFPILMFSGYIQVQVTRTGQKKDAELMEEAGYCANEAIANVRTVQSLGQERIFCERYFDLLYPMYIEAHRQGLIYGIAFALSEAVIFFVYAGSFRYGGYLVEIGEMSPLSVYRVFFAIAFCAVSVGQATSWIPDYNKARLAAGLIFHLLDLKAIIDPFNMNGLRPVLKGQVDFRDVHFRYPSRPDVPVLRGISLQVQPGQTLAVVGPSGCGKSTLVALLERFYDVVSGHIMIDGYDVRSLNVQHLRAHIGVVTQEPVMFDCTIRENIAYGYGDGSIHVPEDLIIESAKIANVHNFIIGLPNGYDTIVGERGAQLSGGERQRVSIARAIIRDPKVLLLDEATSALDTENEKVVQEALDKARVGRTCIIIAHRLSTVQNADSIVVINRGRVVEVGSHDQLKNAKGMYYQLTKTQHISY